MRGEVIGINSVKISDAEGLGFSIPSNLVKSITETLIAHGRVVRRCWESISGDFPSWLRPLV